MNLFGLIHHIQFGYYLISLFPWHGFAWVMYGEFISSIQWGQAEKPPTLN